MTTVAGPFPPAILRPGVNWARVRRVLLIRLRSIGDTVLMTPCLQALRESHPSLEIAVVTEPLSAPILRGHSLIDELFEVGRSTSSRMRAINRIRRWRPDVAYNMHGGTTGMMLAATSGAYYSVGYRGQRGSWMLSTPADAPDCLLGKQKIHSVEQQLALLYSTGIPLPAAATLNISVGSTDAIKLREKLISAGFLSEYLKSARLACLFPGAAFESKRWHARHFGAIADHLSDRWGIESVFLAGPGQEHIAREAQSASMCKGVIVPGLTLGELTVFLSSFASIFIGNDSGPMHIAAAVGCPIVAIFGSSNPDVWHPWTTSPFRVIGGEKGKPDTDLRDTIDRVSVEEVTAAVDEVVQSAGPALPAEQIKAT